ncbi:RNA polymerase sigma factor_gp018 [Bacillus phage vB_BceM_WH1]|nr:RNA polymerase sigma factor_gp018 [Bacillus phage vB_BceM_WH1]
MSYFIQFPDEELLTEEEKIIKENIGLVKKSIEQIFPNIKLIADNHRMDVEDLYQVGMMGLWLAAKRFDHSRKLKFSTYAVATIKGYVYNHIRDSGYMLKFPAEVPTKIRKQFKVVGELVKDANGETINLEEFMPLVDPPSKTVDRKIDAEIHREELRPMFSDKENTVIDLMMQGVELKDVHRRLGVSRQLVNLRKQSIMKKMKARELGLA